MFFYLCKVLFSGFLEFRGNFVDGRNNSKYRDVAPLTALMSIYVNRTGIEIEQLFSLEMELNIHEKGFTIPKNRVRLEKVKNMKHFVSPSF